ncbi:MAG: efflux RND transporter periplasmic adaptor subunit [Sumerlaeia bacterium]
MALPFLSRQIFFLLIAAALATACRPPQRPDGEAAPGENANPDIKKERVFLSPVLIQTAERQEIRATVSTTGSIVPVRSQALATEESGTLRFTREWREGDAVEEGTVIARLDSMELISQIEIDRAEIRIAKENLNIGKQTLEARQREYRTLQDLYAQGVTSQREVDAARLQLQQALNSQKQSQINLEKAEQRLESTLARERRTEIAAPFDGVLVSRSTLQGQGKFQRGFGDEDITVNEGKYVGSGTTVGGVVDIANVYMRVDVTSKDIGNVFPGQPAIVVLYAREDIVAEGEVASISNSVNPDTRAFTVDIALANPEGEDGARRLKPGMFGRADIVTERRRDRIVVPKSVITRRNNMDVVFVVRDKPDLDYDVAEMIAVDLGLEGKDDIEIAFGVQENDRVVIRGYEVLQDQTPVNAIDVDAPTTPTM